MTDFHCTGYSAGKSIQLIDTFFRSGFVEFKIKTNKSVDEIEYLVISSRINVTKTY